MMIEEPIDFIISSNDCEKETDVKNRKKATSKGDADSTDYYTKSKDYIICPWCGHAFEPYPDVEDDEFECHECGKKFLLEVKWTATYSTKKKILELVDHDDRKVVQEKV